MGATSRNSIGCHRFKRNTPEDVRAMIFTLSMPTKLYYLAEPMFIIATKGIRRKKLGESLNPPNILQPLTRKKELILNFI